MIEFRRAQTEDEMIAMYKLRYEVYCLEKRYLNADDYPDQLEHDEWDKYSVHFIATDGTDIVGTVRLIKDSPIGFPTELLFDIARSNIHNKSIAEVSRLIVNPQFKSLTLQIANGLYKVMLNFSIEEGITHWYAVMDKHLYVAYSRIGFTFEQIGESKHCFGCNNSPYVLSLEESLANLKVVNTRMYNFLTESHEKGMVGVIE
ncbi:MAG: GNAT family N-acetyltransferase [Actinobacteria bacterium]|nr:GNAT family N-acetyltransferase [Actinomycetota bacterium]